MHLRHFLLLLRGVLFIFTISVLVAEKKQNILIKEKCHKDNGKITEICDYMKFRFFRIIILKLTEQISAFFMYD